MKLKYYLRGLAVGVILTTIILTVANAGNKPLSDAEIRQRALELGMVESDSIKLSDVAESDDVKTDDESSESYNPSIYETESAEGTEGTKESDEMTGSTEPGSVEKENTESVSQQPSSGEPESIGSTPASTDGAGSASKPPASADGAGSPSVPPASSSAEIESAEPVSITIKSGDSSYTVSKAMAAAGLVEDAVEFDNYLCDNGYSRKIRTGTYEILPGMTYEEIAKEIAN